MENQRQPGGTKKKKNVGGGGNGFNSLGLSDPVNRGVVRMGFRIPTPVQRKAIPVILTGVDTVVMARTGSGKTCAFLIPLLEKLLETPKAQYANHARGIVLSPTRELSMQTLKVLNKLAIDMDIKAVGIHGGEGMEKQFGLLASKPDVIVGTPGRLAHHLREIPDFQLGGCTLCILDEADRLLEMGFAMQLREIARSLPESCQRVLLSATMPKNLIEFTKSGFATDPTVVRLDQEATVSAELRIAFITCRSMDKDAVLLRLLQRIRSDTEAHTSNRTGLTLVFAATRHHVEYITTLLSASSISSTMIYGTLDQEAREANLAAFRHGKKPVLVVTDVAARGIDVPLIDHVIHYHFPPSPKLFVHRSGRAARAGRIGFCWGLVEPDEMPYMVDLHLFLGRHPSVGKSSEDDVCYDLDKMTPDMVHYGSLPESIISEEVENVQRIMNCELSGSRDAQALANLKKVCNNAMKQYRRTRTEASREGVRRAKAILEGERLVTGQRISSGAIPPHPLFRQSEFNGGKALDVENIQRRDEFLRSMSSFRPKETIFEALAARSGKGSGVVSHLDKGTTSLSNKVDTNRKTQSAMKEMRRQVRIAHDKGSVLVIAGSEAAQAYNDDREETKNTETSRDDSAANLHQSDALTKPSPPMVRKPRLSKATRRMLKKDPASDTRELISSATKSTQLPRANDYRDPSFYMENDFTSKSEEAKRSRQIEAAMQPSAGGTMKGSKGAALRMEEAMLDIVGDENDELVKKQRMIRWDKSKRKYIQTNVGQELSGDSKSKKMRLESGQLLKSDKAKLSELYAKWQKKTNMSIGRTGVFDDADGAASAVIRKSGQGGQDEVKTPAAIKKERARKQNSKIKNMKKTDRRELIRKQRDNQGGHQKTASHHRRR